ncbi:hypothetical protein ACQE98_16910 [Ornithinimicrobium sp. W1679]|uniref:hypothetical protein n=1 Tax=Ornithinimicrobium sp. W1679 TaxID=3418770 RepID=UPI003CE69F1A
MSTIISDPSTLPAPACPTWCTATAEEHRDSTSWHSHRVHLAQVPDMEGDPMRGDLLQLQFLEELEKGERAVQTTIALGGR